MFFATQESNLVCNFGNITDWFASQLSAFSLVSLAIVGAFMDAISTMDFDYVASGHYAKVVHTVTNENDAVSFLELSKDMVNLHLLSV